MVKLLLIISIEIFFLIFINLRESVWEDVGSGRGKKERAHLM